MKIKSSDYEKIWQLYLKGQNYEKLGERFKVSKERIRQILLEYRQQHGLPRYQVSEQQTINRLRHLFPKIRKLVEQKKIQKQIIKELRISPYTLKKCLKILEIKPVKYTGSHSKKFTQPIIKRIITDYKKGVKVDLIKNKYDISDPTLYKILKDKKIKKRYTL